MRDLSNSGAAIYECVVYEYAIYEYVRLTFNASFGINVVFVYVLSYKVYTP